MSSMAGELARIPEYEDLTEEVTSECKMLAAAAKEQESKKLKDETSPSCTRTKTHLIRSPKTQVLIPSRTLRSHPLIHSNLFSDLRNPHTSPRNLYDSEIRWEIR